MHIAKVNYQKTFNLGNYTSEKIGIEIELNQGESANKALDICKELVEEYHLKNLKNELQLDVETEPIQQIKSQDKQTLTERTKAFIKACTSVEELRAWEFMSKNNPELKEAYEDVMKTLKK